MGQGFANYHTKKKWKNYPHQWISIKAIYMSELKDLFPSPWTIGGYAQRTKAIVLDNELITPFDRQRILHGAYIPNMSHQRSLVPIGNLPYTQSPQFYQILFLDKWCETILSWFCWVCFVGLVMLLIRQYWIQLVCSLHLKSNTSLVCLDSESYRIHCKNFLVRVKENVLKQKFISRCTLSHLKSK